MHAIMIVNWKKITEGNMREKVLNNRSMTIVHDFVKFLFVW